ncbi:glycoside hydrolase family 9 protein [Spirosoma sp. BT702]|uniref:Glycoside hydrolase family 9 protein n=1 Tax=Spirosoma profusum TaxID=2771354 RepID=A0A927AR72_9BACT|nr:glycoside hydrolase family 9 protein [Spirosoma profusum]MBD2699270.1 glycoside hydrolase family 9 protein [Spirosoma profusum]
MKSTFLIFIILSLCLAHKSQSQNPVNGTGSITSGGRTRTFAYHLPTTSPATNLPLVIAFHGDGGTGAGLQGYAGLDNVANTQNFIVVYPNAVTVGGGIQFNKYADTSPGFGSAGDSNGPNPIDPNAPDDVLLTSDLIDYFAQTYQINRSRVYATGHSGGGFMCYFLSMALPNKIAAIAPVAASLWANQTYQTNYFTAGNYTPIPVMHIHSAGDPTVTPPIQPYPKTPAYVWPISTYAGLGCNNWNSYTTTALNPNVDSLTFCSSGKKAVFVITKDATHGWPSAFNAAQTIWNFFKTQQLPAAPVSSDFGNHLKIDQFGYLPLAKKIAVISSPQTGYNASDTFTPSTTYQLRNATNDAVVFQGTPVAWNSGATHAQSGDKVWWFDFSSVQTPGTYYVYDVGKDKKSYPFSINNTVYQDVLKQATRVFYYQRSGFAKQTPYAESPWTDGAAFLGTQQDTDCRLVSNTSAATSKDLRGGWFDAGDYNKYVPFTYGPLVDMLLSYQENPTVWTDDFNIPESGNGVPDLLDEVKWELDWLLRMQQANGSLLHKVSVTDFSATSPPSADTNFRRYGAASTDATATGAAVFALAAIQFKSLSNPTMQAFGNTLQTAAINAYNWANSNPSVIFNNSGFSSAAAVGADHDRISRRVAAAAFLYVLTGNATYKTYFDANYNQVHLIQWSFAYPFEATYQDALLYYTKAPGATTSVKNNILSTYANNLKTGNSDNLPSYLNQSDAYRAFLKNDNYTWGSNETKAHQGNMFFSMNVYNQDTTNKTNYRDAALGFVHYLHGVNPTSYSYLTNMEEHGGEFTAPTMYHSWFADGTVFDTNPPPGYVMGGANPTYTNDAGIIISPPQNQPIQKSYKAWNTSYPENSWQINEPAIYTQGAYIRLLSQAMKYIDVAPCGTEVMASVKSGSWNDPTTWACGRVPTNTENVLIQSGHNVTINAVTVNAKKLDLRGKINYVNGGKLQLAN